ncbi:MAG: M18 family aminopeptidase [Firmicutes bacterium]|nr:M18 family aminopeptidase [Bacillota bacterium]
MNQQLFEYIEKSPTAYQAVSHTVQILKNKGYKPLCESEDWKIEAGKGYYITRNGSSVIAFRVPYGGLSGFMIAAAHCDSPCFKIKENAEIVTGAYVQLSVEKYGGMLCSSWLDRPLSIAGRILAKTETGVESMLVDTRKPVAVIPNVAIHMNRNANDGMSYNAAVDMLPLYGSAGRKGSFKSIIADISGVNEADIISSDLFLYNPEPGVEWGDFISAPRLDDLQCAYAALTAFIQSGTAGSAPVFCLFDNEEVGSQTKQGAASTFLFDVLLRLSLKCGLDDGGYRAAIANSFLVSCDNAHAQHPNHPEYADKNHTVYMNKGIVIKYNANQRYTSDALSAALFRTMTEEAGVPFQDYANRADMPGGSTLGNIANTQVSLNSVDIGLAQLAMHSSFETAGASDTEYMIKALTVFFAKKLKMESDGVYTII